MTNNNSTPKTPSDLFSAMHRNGTLYLQEIHKAAYAIEAAQRLLAAVDSDEDHFSDYTTGGLQEGIGLLAKLIASHSVTLLGWLGADGWSTAEREKIEEAASAAQ